MGNLTPSSPEYILEEETYELGRYSFHFKDGGIEVESQEHTNAFRAEMTVKIFCIRDKLFVYLTAATLNYS
ncbi:UNVERIFIED_CONTAM: hypothetical protein K2H54_048418 [Gekko kuhli]